MPSSDVRVVIADDEPLARRGIRLRLERAGGFSIVAETSNGIETSECILAERPDVVFLDVQMPEGGGFDVVRLVGVANMPITIFVTAYDEHALRAFDAQALDYLLKPIDDARFARMLERVRALATKQETPGRLLLRDGPRSLLLDYDEIDRVESDGDYVRVHTGARSHLVRHTISALEKELDAARFARIHRSVIVNIARIRELRRSGDRAFEVILADGTVVRASRSYRERIKAMML